MKTSHTPSFQMLGLQPCLNLCHRSQRYQYLCSSHRKLDDRFVTVNNNFLCQCSHQWATFIHGAIHENYRHICEEWLLACLGREIISRLVASSENKAWCSATAVITKWMQGLLAVSIPWYRMPASMLEAVNEGLAQQQTKVEDYLH